MNKEAIVIGLGISGCVSARLLADAGYSVTCFERESLIGGNLVEELRPNGQRIQAFGPHIFHTDHEEVYAFLKRFGNFYPYTHRVLAGIDGTIVPVPLNFNSLTLLFGSSRSGHLQKKLVGKFGKDTRVGLSSLLSSGDTELIGLGKYINEHLQIANINRKDDGTFSACDDSYMYDTYVVTGDSDNYYPDKFQAMPILGFIPLLESMLSHQKITYHTNTDAFARLSLVESTGSFLFDGIPFKGPVIYTPSLDILFDFRYGRLPYRTSKISYEDVDQDYYLESAVLTDANDASSVRVSESKYFTMIDTPGRSSICREAPYEVESRNNGEPFEPAITPESRALYSRYADLADRYSSLYLLGRLACFKNMSIAECITQAMTELPL